MAGEPADHALGRSRGGYGTKLHLVVAARHGVPLAAVLTPGERHESTQVATLLGRVVVPKARRWPRRGPRREQARRRPPRRRPGRPGRRPTALAGDKGYSYRTVRQYLQRRGIRAVIPTRADQRANPRFDKATYRRRNIIERVVGWLKECRRLATRYEKLAVNFLAMVTLAMIQRCVRILDSSNRA